MAVRSARQSIALIVIIAACVSASGRLPGPAQTESTRLDEMVFEAYRKADPLTAWPLKKLLHEIPDLKGLQPADDQAALPGILSHVGDNVQALLANFVNTTALETIQETRMRNYPATEDDMVQRFHYLMVLQAQDLTATLVEYRTDLHGREDHSDMTAEGFVKTVGFASMPLYLGPTRRKLSDFRYLGRQLIDGRRTEVVGFAEHPEPEAARGGIMLAATFVPAIYQGIAWIDAASYQIVRMRTDLLAPLLVIQLNRETTEVRFHEVRFPQVSTPMWLPEEVDVTVGLKGLVYVNRHHYSDYQIFNVSTDQQIGSPKAGSRP